MGLLDGYTAVVTGGGSGIGAETCRRMAAEGAQIAVFDGVLAVVRDLLSGH